jgi:hypothetical protein
MHFISSEYWNEEYPVYLANYPGNMAIYAFSQSLNTFFHVLQMKNGFYDT